MNGDNLKISYRARRKKRQFDHQAGLCCWCLESMQFFVDQVLPWPLDAATWEHIVPRSLAGPNPLVNLVLACRRCNEARSSQDWGAPHFASYYRGGGPAEPRHAARKRYGARALRVPLAEHAPQLAAITPPAPLPWAAERWDSLGAAREWGRWCAGGGRDLSAFRQSLLCRKPNQGLSP